MLRTYYSCSFPRLIRNIIASIARTKAIHHHPSITHHSRLFNSPPQSQRIIEGKSSEEVINFKSSFLSTGYCQEPSFYRRFR
jgi:hypothetical protein